MIKRKNITLSIVSHGNFKMISKLLKDIDNLKLSKHICEVIITKNISENGAYELKNIPLKVIENDKAKGFGANHNCAFKIASGEYFCVVNPDVRIKNNVFYELIKVLESEPKAGVIAPYVFSSMGHREDNLRHYPSIWTLIKKIFFIHESVYPEKSQLKPYQVEWAAGMFLIFNSQLFRIINGFDENFYLYYEDVDICRRSWLAGWAVLACPTASVEHDAQRSSHKKIKYFFYHIKSIFRYFIKTYTLRYK